ncbi:hypothetical protein PFICI_06886 [Pestalotiopsis fici W106-1]|uniref:Thioredoxin-like fold domain-containing protein n=1 Tax=Pestalotiopsis fici (strain W106-1 / CGMCC3.15140) TaxID=1229662 RepID=W3X776_PESFW|nr:uncharacterized protein PFICI_06886 [Pestalotiopsis fici W106-1]ETS81884.1 hypothetical protein PFICI_06886 [Pestalotiopsis fici W106-1]
MATVDPSPATSVPGEAAPMTEHDTTTIAGATPAQQTEAPKGQSQQQQPTRIDTAAASATAQTPASNHGSPTTTTKSPITGAMSSSPVDIQSVKGLGDATAEGAIPSQDDTNPLDFHGDVQTNNSLPTPETLRKLEQYTVLDESGKSRPFKSLYTGPNVARRVLIIFIRHFFCGNCQEYLRQLSAAIPPERLLQLPVSTSIAVIGCGSPKLISAYLRETGCPYPVYADNTQHLYRELGMIRTLSAGDRPAYMQNRSMAQTVVSGITQALKQVKSGLILQMGDQKQVGGEFLFEPTSRDVESPIATPHDHPVTTTAAAAAHDHSGLLHEEDCPANGHHDEPSEDKTITWCHRMRNTRDHVEIPELMDVLGLEEEEVQNRPPSLDNAAGSQKSGKHGDRWAKASRTRKGTGSSMASRMSRMSLDAKAWQRPHPPPVDEVEK